MRKRLRLDPVCCVSAVLLAVAWLAAASPGAAESAPEAGATEALASGPCPGLAPRPGVVGPPALSDDRPPTSPDRTPVPGAACGYGRPAAASRVPGRVEATLRFPSFFQRFSYRTTGPPFLTG